MKKIFALLLLLASLTVSAKNFADYRDFEKVQFLTTHPQVMTTSLEAIGLSKDFDKEEILNSLSHFVELQSEVWMDTILEGDYVQTSRATLKDITVFMYRGEILAYQVSYEASALQTSSESCSFDEASETWGGEGCVTGKIQESAFVDASYRFIHSENYPEFISE